VRVVTTPGDDGGPGLTLAGLVADINAAFRQSQVTIMASVGGADNDRVNLTNTNGIPALSELRIQPFNTGIKGGGLKIISSAPVALNTSINDVEVLAAKLYEGSCLKYEDANDLSIGTIGVSGSAPYVMEELAGITSAGTILGGLHVCLATTDGHLTVDSEINLAGKSPISIKSFGNGKNIVLNASVTSGSGDIILHAWGTVTQNSPASATTAAPGKVSIIENEEPVRGDCIVWPLWIHQGPAPQNGGRLLVGIADQPVTGAVQDIAVDTGDFNRVFIGTVGGGVWKNNDRTIFFDEDEYDLRDDNTPQDVASDAERRAVLAEFAQFLLAHPDLTVQVHGHTDSVGGPAANQDLSEDRADEVAAILRSENVPASRIIVTAAGEDRPIVPHNLPDPATPAGATPATPKNRRVELIVNYWEPLTDNFPSLSIKSIAISPWDNTGSPVTATTPTSNLVIYAGTGSTSASAFSRRPNTSIGVLRSTNGGETWQILQENLPPDTAINAIDFATSTTGEPVLLVATNGFRKGGSGLFRSLIGGVTFDDDTFTDMGSSGAFLLERIVTDIVVDPLNRTSVFVGVPSPGIGVFNRGIYYSNDGGVSWNPRNGSDPTVLLANLDDVKQIHLTMSETAEGTSFRPVYAAAIGEIRDTTNSISAGANSFFVAEGTSLQPGDKVTITDSISLVTAGLAAAINAAGGPYSASVTGPENKDLEISRPGSQFTALIIRTGQTAATTFPSDGGLVTMDFSRLTPKGGETWEIALDDLSSVVTFEYRVRSDETRLILSIGPAIGGLQEVRLDGAGLTLGRGSDTNLYVRGQRLLGLYRSDRLGLSWTRLDLPGTIEGNGTDPGSGFFGIHVGRQGKNHFSIVADPTNPFVIYVGGDRQPGTGAARGEPSFSSGSLVRNSLEARDYSGRLFRLDLQQTPGSQWQAITDVFTDPDGAGPLSGSAPHADSRALAFQGGRLLEADDGGLYRLIDPRQPRMGAAAEVTTGPIDVSSTPRRFLVGIDTQLQRGDRITISGGGAALFDETAVVVVVDDFDGSNKEIVVDHPLLQDRAIGASLLPTHHGAISDVTTGSIEIAVDANSFLVGIGTMLRAGDLVTISGGGAALDETVRIVAVDDDTGNKRVTVASSLLQDRAVGANLVVSAWQSVNDNLSLSEFYSVSSTGDSMIIGGTQDNGTALQPTPGSIVWNQVQGGDGGIVQTSGATIYFSSQKFGAFTVAAPILEEMVAGANSILVPKGTPFHDGDRLRVLDDSRSLSFTVSGEPTEEGDSLRVTLVETLPASSDPVPLGTLFGLRPALMVNGTRGGNLKKDTANTVFDSTVQFVQPFVLNSINPDYLLIGTQYLYVSIDNGRTLNLLNGTPSKVRQVGANFDYALVEGANIGRVKSLVYGGRQPDVAGVIQDHADVIYVGTDLRYFTSPDGTVAKRPPDNNFSLWVRQAGAGDFAPVQKVISFGNKPIQDVAIDPNDWTRVYVLDSKGRIWFSADGANPDTTAWNWKRLDLGNKPPLLNITNNLSSLPGAKNLQQIVVDTSSGKEVLLVVGEGGVFRRVDRGYWTEYGAGLPNALVTAIELNDDDSLLIGTLGRGAWKILNASQTLSTPSVLRLTGTSQEDEIRLVRNADQPWLLDVYRSFVSDPLVPTSVPFAMLSSIIIDGRASDDTIIVDASNGAIAVPGGISIDGGPGNDTIDITRPAELTITNSAGDLPETGVSSGSHQQTIVDSFGVKQTQFVEWHGIEPTSPPGTILATRTIDAIPAGLQEYAFAFSDIFAESVLNVTTSGFNAASLAGAFNGLMVDSDSVRAKDDPFLTTSQVAADGQVQIDDASSILLRLFNEAGFSLGDIGANGAITTPEELEAAFIALPNFTVNEFRNTAAETFFDVQTTGLQLSGIVDLDVRATANSIGEIVLTGLLEISATVDLHLRFGVDDAGFYVLPDVIGEPTLTIRNLTIDGDVTASGQLGFLGVDVNAATLSLDPDAAIEIYLKDPKTQADDSFIRVPEFAPTDFTQLVSTKVIGDPKDGTGSAATGQHDDVVLTGMFEVSALLPGLATGITLASAELTVSWADLTSSDQVQIAAVDPTFPDAQQFLSFLEVTSQQVLDGLTTLQSLLDIFDADIPFVSKNLAQFIDLVSQFQTKILDPLRDPVTLEAELPTAQEVAVALATGLGIDLESLALAYDSASKELTYDLTLATAINDTETIDFLLDGLVDLDFEASVNASLDFDLTLGIDVGDAADGLNPLDSFFIKNGSVSGTVDITASGIDAEGHFGFLDIEVLGGNGSANLTFDLTLSDPNGDGRIDLREIIGDPLTVIGTPTITGSANFNLPVSVTSNLPGVDLSGDFTLQIDTADLSASAPTATVTTGAGGATLNVAGQTLNGDFIIELVKDASGNDLVRVATSGVTMNIGDGAVNVSSSLGLFLIGESFVAGSFDGTATFSITGFTFTSPSVKVEINSGSSPINETFTIASTSVPLNLPAGPFLRVVAVVEDANPIDIAGNTLTGTFAFDQITRPGPDGQINLADDLDPVNTDNEIVTRIVMTDVTVRFGDITQPAVLTNGQGALVVMSTGVAGFLSGNATAEAAGFELGGSVLLRINKTGGAVDEVITLNGQEVVIHFGADEGDVFDLSITDLSLNIANVVTIEGEVSFVSRTIPDGAGGTINVDGFAGEGLRIFFGEGPATLENGDPNPLARGLLLDDTRIALIKGSGGEFALDATGTLHLVGFGGATVTGSGRVRVNSFTIEIDEILTIPGTEQDVFLSFGAGELGDGTAPFSTFRGLGLDLTLLDQVFTGDLDFQKITLDPLGTPGDPTDDVKGIRIGASNVDFDIGGVVSLTDGSGDLLFTSEGVAGSIGGTVGIDLPDVAVAGSFDLLFNTTSQAVGVSGLDADLIDNDGDGLIDSADLDGEALTLSVPAGPYLRVSGIGATLSVLGQDLTGGFLFERLTSNTGETITRLAADNVTLSVSADDGTTVTDFVSVEYGTGSLLVTTAGVAGEISAQVNFVAPEIDSFDLTGGVTISVNTTDVAVMETFNVGVEKIVLDLPAGPYVRVDANDVTLTIDGQNLTGDFSFEQTTNEDAEKVVRVGAAGVSFVLNDGSTDVVTLSDGQGNFLLQTAGIAGELSGAITVAVPTVSLSGRLTLQINETGNVINELFQVGGSQVLLSLPARASLSLPAGPFIRFAGEDVAIEVLGQTLRGSLAVTKSGGAIELEINDGNLDLGNGLVQATILNATFVISSAGIATQGPASAEVVFNIPGVSFGTDVLTVDIDTTNPADRFVRVEGTAVSLEVAGQSLTADFSFEQGTSSSGERVVKVAVDQATMTLGTFVSFSGGSGQLVVSSSGVAGAVSVIGATVNIPGLLNSTFDLDVEINTSPFEISETFTINNSDVPLTLPAGPFLRVLVEVEETNPINLDVGGVTGDVYGNLFFEQTVGAGPDGEINLENPADPVNDDNEIESRVSVTEFEVKFSAQLEPTLVDGEGAFVVKAAGVAGFVSGTANLAAGGVEVGGSVLLRLNTTAAAVDEVITVGGREIAIRFGDDEGEVFSISVTSLSLNIADFVTVEGNVSFDTVTLTGGATADVFAGEGLEIFLGRGPARLENGDVNPLATGVLLSDATIGLIRIDQSGTDTFALFAEGTVSLVGVDGISISGTATVRVNTTGIVIDETLTIPGSSNGGVRVQFDSDSEVKSFAVLDAELSVLEQTLTGDFSFDTVTGADVDGAVSFAASNVSLSLGDGSTGLVNVTNGEGVLIITGSGIAGELAATIEERILGVDFAGAFTVKINTTSAPVEEVFVVGEAQFSIDIRAGPFLSVSGEGVTLTVLGQTLSGNFAFEQLTSVAGETLTRVAASDVSYRLMAGGTNIVSVTEGQGGFIVTSGGIAGELSGGVTLNIPEGAHFRGEFSLAINNTNLAVNEQFTVAGETITLDLPFGPYVRVQGVGIELDLLGQTLSGDFAFESVTSLGANGVVGGGDDIQAVRVAARSVSLSLGDGTTNFIQVTDGRGALFIMDGEMAGEIGGTVNIDVPGVSISGTLRVQFTNSTSVFSETFLVGPVPVTLELPAGPFLRVEGTGVDIGILGQTLSGDFVIEQLRAGDGDTIVRVGASNVTLGLGGPAGKPILSITNGIGNFILTSGGIAGSLEDDFALNVGGLAVSGDFKVLINSTLAPVSEAFQVNGTPATIDLPAGPYLRFEGGTGGLPAILSVLGQELSGSFVFEQFANAAGEAVLRVAVADASLSLADGTLSAYDGEGLFVITPAGVAGTLRASVGLDPTSGVSLTGEFSLTVNSTNLEVSEVLQVGASTISFNLPAGPFVKINGENVRLQVLGQTLSGDFALEQITTGRGPDGIPGTNDDIQAIRIAAADVSMALGNGSTNILTASNGEGTFLIFEKMAGGLGIAGRLSANVALQNVPGVSISGALTIEVNNTDEEVSEVFFVGGLPVEFELEAGNYVRVFGDDLELNLLGQTLTGDFSFEQVTSTDGGGASNQVIRITATGVKLALGDGTTDFIRIENGQGYFVVKEGDISPRLGVAGEFIGDVIVDVPAVSLEGQFKIQINTIPEPIDETFNVDGTPLNLVLTAATDLGGGVIEPFFTVEGGSQASPLTLNILGQQLAAVFTIERFTMPGGKPVIKIHLENTSVVDLLTLGSGAQTFITVTNGTGDILIDPLGIAARLVITPSFTLPGLTLSGGTTTLEVNTLPIAVDEVFTFAGIDSDGIDNDFDGNIDGADTDGEDWILSLPAGPFFRVEAIGASLTITGAGLGNGNIFQGNFVFDQSTKAGFSAGVDAGSGDTGSTTAVALGDVDDDGDLDLLVANDGAKNRYYLNNGVDDTGIFLGFASGQDFPEPASFLDADNTSTSMVLGDVDDDGDLDVVVGNQSQANRIYLNNGTTENGTALVWQGFTDGQAISADTGTTTSVALGDADGDGLLDLVVGNDGEANQLHLNQGFDETTGAWNGFAGGTDVETGETDSTSAMALGDVDGDDLLDIIVGNNGEANQLYLNGGFHGTTGAWNGFTSGTDIEAGESDSTTSVTLGDVDGDNTLDLIVGNDLQTNKLYINDGVDSGGIWLGFADSQDITTDAGATTSLALGDVDGDDDLDLVVGNNGTNKVYLNNGSDQPFSDAMPIDLVEDPSVAAAVTATSIALANIDGDRDLDLLAANDGQANLLYSNDQVKVTRIAANNLELTVGGARILQNGEAAFVLLGSGFAGFASGEVDVTPGGTDFTAGANIGVRVNKTGQPVDETIELGGETLVIRFEDGTDTFELFGDVSLKIGDFITIEGSVSFSSVPGGDAASGTANIFVGQGPATLDDGVTLNPSARGVLLHNARFGVFKDSSNRYALFAEGQLMVLGVPGIDFSGIAQVRFNETTSNVDDLVVPDSPFDQDSDDELVDLLASETDKTVNLLEVDDSSSGIPESIVPTLEILGQKLKGQFEFELGAEPGLFRVGLTNVDLPFGEEGEGGLFPVSVSASGDLTMTSAGIFGAPTASPSINVPGFSISGNIALKINTTDDPQTVGAVELPAGQISAQATGIDLTILGQTLSGDFAFEQYEGQLSPQAANVPGAEAPKIMRIAATNVGLFLGDDGGTPGDMAPDTDDDAGVRLTGGEGFFVLNGTGIAGRLSGGLDISIPGAAIEFQGTFGVAINTTGGEVNEQFEVGPQTINLSLPAGPYLRVEGTDVTLELLGQRILGDFAFEEVTQPSGDKIVRVLAQNVTIGIGDGATNFVSLSQGFGFFVLKSGVTPDNAVFAGEVSGNVVVSVPGVSLEGSFSLAINNSSQVVSETISLGPDADMTTAVALGDVNDDGLIDLVVGNSGEVNVLYLNDGAGDPFDALTPQAIGIETEPTTAVALGDVDKDGDLDLIVGNNGAPNRLYLNDGMGLLELDGADLGTGATTAVALGDIDGDGFEDVVVGITGAINRIFLNQGRDAGTGEWLGFYPGSNIGSESDSTSSLALGDVDNDDDIDLMVGNSGTTTTNRLYLNVGGTLTLDTNLPGDTSDTRSIALGDVNNDGFIDLVAGNYNEPNQYYLNLGENGSWQGFDAALNVAGDVNDTTAVSLNDINGDGDPDVVVGNDGQPTRLYLNGNVDDDTGLWNGFETGEDVGVNGASDVDATGPTTSIALANISNDDDLDLVVGEYGAPNRIFLGDDDGNLDDGADIGVITLDVDIGGPYVRVEGDDISLTVLGQTLTGSFRFVQQSRPDGQRVVEINVHSATLSLGEGLADINVTGSLLITDDGVAGKLGLGASLDLGPVVLSGNLNLLINTLETPVVLNDVHQTRLPAGEFLRIEGIGIQVDIGGVVLTGDFLVEQTTNQVGQRRLTIAATGVSLTVGDIAMTEGEGILLVFPERTLPDGTVQPGGIAGSLSARLDLDGLIDGVSFSGSFGIAINQTSRAILEQIQIDDETLTLDLPTGPFLRVEGQSVELNILGQTLSGNFAFEQAVTPGPDGLTNLDDPSDQVNDDNGSITRIGATEVQLRLGDGTTDFVTLTQGQGSFVILDVSGTNKLAGELSGTVALNIPGVTFYGTLGLKINDTGLLVDETLVVGGEETRLLLEGGNYVRISGTGLSLEVLGQRLSGDFFFEQSRKAGPDGTLGTADDGRIVRLGAKNVEIFLGDDKGTADTADDLGLLVSQMETQEAKFLITDDGLAGELEATVAQRGIVGLTLGGSITLQINNTTQPVNELFEGLSQRLVLPAGPFVRVEVDGTLDVAGQVLGGIFAFEQITSAGADEVINTTDDAEILRIAATNVRLFLGDDGGTPGDTAPDTNDDAGIRISKGNAKFLITPAGFAGEIGAAASIKLGVATATADEVLVQINNTTQAVSEEFLIGGETDTLELPAGPFFSASLTGLSINVAGQTLTGDFTFIQIIDNPDTAEDETEILLRARNVGLRIGTDSRDFVIVRDGEGDLRIQGGATNSGIAGRVMATVEVDIPGVTVGGTFEVEIATASTPASRSPEPTLAFRFSARL
jgi:hypothetical protein